MNKTAWGLVSYCKAQIGKPYWWGCFGQTATEALFTGKRAQYPSHYTAGDFQSQYGQKVHDCAGLIKGYRWCDSPDGKPIYNMVQDVSVAGLFDQCRDKGDIASMPDMPGVCVFRGDLGHVGVYIGDAQVIEARGHAQGVIKTSLKSNNWAFWGKPDWIDYGSATGATVSGTSETSGISGYTYTVQLPLLKQGATGGYVKTLQRLLIAAGLSVGADGADGEFGENTKKAVIKFQQLHGLEDDGEVGGMTWAALLRG